jgi:hypothetical protein
VCTCRSTYCSDMVYDVVYVYVYVADHGYDITDHGVREYVSTGAARCEKKKNKEA